MEGFSLMRKERVINQTIIFDVDGTIADCEHRRHLVTGEKKDWKNFKKAAEHDTPIQWVCDVAKRFIANGDDVAFFSARNESQRKITEKQISKWIGDGHKGLFLRPDGDYRSDVEFKRELANKFLDMGGKIDLIFDDRQCVVDMWRDEGFVVVQVADGDF